VIWKGQGNAVAEKNAVGMVCLVARSILLAIQALEPSASHGIVTLAIDQELSNALQSLLLGEWSANLLVAEVAVVLHLFTRVLHVDDAKGR
jgi:hypothetical protein